MKKPTPEQIDKYLSYVGGLEFFSGIHGSAMLNPSRATVEKFRIEHEAEIIVSQYLNALKTDNPDTYEPPPFDLSQFPEKEEEYKSSYDVYLKSVDSGRKMQAIKLMKSLSVRTLQQAKDVVDNVISGNREPIIVGTSREHADMLKKQFEFIGASLEIL